MVAAAAAVFMVIVAAVPASAEKVDDLADVRHATNQFRSLMQADRAGYVPFLPCFDAPGVGGMGQHFLNEPLLDGIIEATKPEVLVYEPHQDGYKLVAVEYVVPQALWTGDHAPMLFGEPFHPNATLGIWALHAWIWRDNPLGVHEDYSPNVRMCP